jgi:CheY-like chemotaxis protein
LYRVPYQENKQDVTVSLIKALIVDDSKSARFSLRKMLSNHDIEADDVDSGPEAIAYLKNADVPPQVIFMDHMMPDMDGLETTRAIVADSDIPDIPIIMCTSNEGEEYLAEAKATGASGVISKPPTREGLEQVISSLAAEAETEAAPAEAPTPAVSGELIEARIEAVTQNILQRVEARTRELVTESFQQDAARLQDETLIACNTQIQELREEILRASREQTNDLIRTELEGHVGEVIKAGLDDLQEKARQAEQAWLAEQDNFRTSINESARQTAESVMANAGGEARRIASEVTEQAIQKVTGDMTSSGTEAVKQARLMAIGAGILGVLAAAVVYFLK